LPEVNLARAVKDWCASVALARGNNKTLNLRIFEAEREDFCNDVEIV